MERERVDKTKAAQIYIMKCIRRNAFNDTLCDLWLGLDLGVSTILPYYICIEYSKHISALFAVAVFAAAAADASDCAPSPFLNYKFQCLLIHYLLIAVAIAGNISIIFISEIERKKEQTLLRTQYVNKAAFFSLALSFFHFPILSRS